MPGVISQAQLSLVKDCKAEADGSSRDVVPDSEEEQSEEDDDDYDEAGEPSKGAQGGAS